MNDTDNRIPVITLRYRDGAFIHTEYERLRDSIMEYVNSRRNDPILLTAINRYLGRELLRGDFLLSESICRENLQATRAISQRNYWTSVL